MRLVCRECSAAYEAPDTLFGAQPREVRCNRCGFQWTVIGAVKGLPGAAPQAIPAQAVSPQTDSPPAAPLPPDPVQPDPAQPSAAPPELIREPAAASLAPEPVAPPPAPSRLADHLAGPLPDPAPAAHPPSTRSLLQRDDAAADFEMSDPEERRLSHELNFGEADHRPGGTRPVRRRRGGLWLLAMLVIVLIIAAVLFEPQILSAVPALGALYRTIGL